MLETAWARICPPLWLRLCLGGRVYPQAGNRLFQGIEDGAYFYFVHSYAMPVNPWTIAQCNYGEPFTAAVQKDNFYGVQFHPERSGAAGAKLLKNFLEM